MTDGTGATEFLKELVKNYLYLIHKVNGLEPVSLLPEDMTVQDQEVDSFLKYYSKDQKRPEKRKLHAFQIRRKKKDGNHLHVHESVVSETKTCTFPFSGVYFNAFEMMFLKIDSIFSLSNHTFK